MKKQMMVSYDETGTIGKRYRRADAVGTPFAVTVDDETGKWYRGIAETAIPWNRKRWLLMRWPIIFPGILS